MGQCMHLSHPNQAAGPKPRLSCLARTTASARQLRPIPDLVREIEAEASADAVEYAIDDLRAWALTADGASEVCDQGGVRAIRGAMASGRFTDDELIARTCIRCLATLAKFGVGAQAMQDIGLIEEIESTFMRKWSAEEGMVVVSFTAVTTARESLAKLAAASMTQASRKLSLSHVLRVLTDNTYHRAVVLRSLEALRRIALTVTAYELLDPEVVARLELVNRLPEMYADDEQVICLLVDALCDIAANSHNGANRSLLGGASMVRCWLRYLQAGLDRNMSVVTMQFALFLLSELCRGDEDNTVLLLTDAKHRATEILSEIRDRSRRGGYAEPVVLPLVLSEIVKNHKAILADVKEKRAELRDLRSWVAEHYGPEVKRCGMEHVRRIAFRKEGLFPPLPPHGEAGLQAQLGSLPSSGEDAPSSVATEAVLA